MSAPADFVRAGDRDYAEGFTDGQREIVAVLRPLVAIVNGAKVTPAKRAQYLDAARAAIAKAEGQS